MGESGFGSGCGRLEIKAFIESKAGALGSKSDMS